MNDEIDTSNYQRGVLRIMSSTPHETLLLDTPLFHQFCRLFAHFVAQQSKPQHAGVTLCQTSFEAIQEDAKL